MPLTDFVGNRQSSVGFSEGGMMQLVPELIEKGKLGERDGRLDEARRLFEEALHALGSSANAATASALLRWNGRTFHTDGHYGSPLDRLDAAPSLAAPSG